MSGLVVFGFCFFAFASLLVWVAHLHDKLDRQQKEIGAIADYLEIEFDDNKLTAREK